MCGIAGYYYGKSTGKPSWANKSTLTKMMQLTKHRGPDHTAISMGAGYGLGHNRLTVIDLTSASNQPMWCENDRYGLVFNGEIYNYKSVRAELEACGHSFKSEGDTEVLLKSLIHWGVNCFNRLEGMFAGAFIDKITGVKILFRDHLGIKPLYFMPRENSLIFASEIKALSLTFKNSGINHEVFYEQIRFRYVAGKNTIYDGVERVLAGHYLVFDDDGGYSTHQYYNVTEKLKSKTSFSPPIADIEHSINQSISSHLVSDVGFAVQLSGGVDSSYISHVVAKNGKPFDTYSVSLPGDLNDEKVYQMMVSERYQTRHHSFDFDGNKFADILPEVTYHLDAPIVHAGTVFLFELCRNISKQHKVVLTGEGADELFLGYDRYKIPLSTRIAYQLQRHNISHKLIPNIPKFRAIKFALKRNLGLEAGIFHSEVAEDIVKKPGLSEFRELNISNFDCLLDQMVATDQRVYLDSLLERQDKVSMAHGLEARVPFCNHRLFDQINPIRHKLKITPEPKSILKNLLSKHFSSEFVYRRKNGFNLPLADWFRNTKHLGRYLDYLSDQTFKNRIYYNHKLITDMINRHRSGDENFGNELFTLLSFEIWARQNNF